MHTILLTNTKHIVFIDDGDFVKLNEYSWTENKGGYAVRYTGKGVKKRTVIYMHREIIKLVYPEIQIFETDHIDRNKLNNQRFNLRICSRSQNAHNIKSLNIWKRKDTGKWTSQIMINRIVFNLGCFNTKEEAIKIYLKHKQTVLPAA